MIWFIGNITVIKITFRILKLIREIIQYLKEDESPAFIHFITMQNHLSYPKMDELPFRYDIEGIDKDDLDDFEAYLQGITDTDLATEQFVDRLRNFDKLCHFSCVWRSSSTTL